MFTENVLFMHLMVCVRLIIRTEIVKIVPRLVQKGEIYYIKICSDIITEYG